MRKKTLLYFYVGKSTFINKDLNFFREQFEVHEFNFEVNAKWKTILRFINQLFFLFKFLRRSTLLVSQFSAYHSFLPGLFSKLSGKPFLIISGGTDCHSFPSIGYGNFQKPLLAAFTRWSYKLCSHISPKHISLWECNYTYDGNDFEKQGIHYFLPKLEKPVTCIANGYDSNMLQASGERKKNSILTIAGNLNYPFQARLKGIDLFIEAAIKFPDCSFTLVGVNNKTDVGNLPANITCLPSQENHELIKLYSTHTYYFQLSMAEGFPNTLCEAMLCECVPVGSNVFSIPEIIGDAGFILTKKDNELLFNLLKKALISDTISLGKLARERISKNYPLSKRKKALLELSNSLTM